MISKYCQQNPVCDECIPVREHILSCGPWDVEWDTSSHTRDVLSSDSPQSSPWGYQESSSKDLNREVLVGRGGMPTMLAQPSKSSWCCPTMQEELVILLTRVRESCAARPPGVEAGGSAAVSPAQPDPPRNTGDPWKPRGLGVTLPATLKPIPAHAPAGPHRPSLLVFLVSATLKRGTSNEAHTSW